MHVLLIHQAFVSGDEAGGTRHFELAQHLARQGHRVTIIASPVSYLTGKASLSPRDAVVSSSDGRVQIRRAWTYAALHRSFFTRVLSFLSFMVSSFIDGFRVREVDVVLGTMPPIFQAVSAYLLARARRIPFALEVRDLWPDFAIELGVLSNPVLIRASRWLERFLYVHADHLIVNSPGFAPHLCRVGANEKKIDLVPNGVEVGMFDPGDRGDAFRKELGLESRFVALYAGAHGLANDLGTILLAAKRLESHREVVFVLVGDGKERPNLVREAEELGLSNVRFVPAQPKSRMPGCLAASDVCLATLKPLPMFTTTYPNKVFDYMAAGRPTIVAIDGVIRDVIETAEAGKFVPPGDHEALAEAVLYYYNDSDMRHRDGTNARSYVGAHFDRPGQANKLAAVLEQAASRQPSAGADERSAGTIRRAGTFGYTVQQGAKRAFDIALSLLCLVLFSPVFLVMCVTILVSMGRPLLFRQARLGYRGQVFTILKFRTMEDTRDNNGELLPDERRLTRVGRLLRSTTLDELPELINVLRGEMSIVGPRPLIAEYRDLYTPDQMRRHDTPPGMAGPVVAGGRNSLSWEDKFALDVWYVDHRTFFLDIKILFTAVMMVLRRKGISAEGSATMPAFQGSTRHFEGDM